VVSAPYTYARLSVLSRCPTDKSYKEMNEEESERSHGFFRFDAGRPWCGGFQTGVYGNVQAPGWPRVACQGLHLGGSARAANRQLCDKLLGCCGPRDRRDRQSFMCCVCVVFKFACCALGRCGPRQEVAAGGCGVRASAAEGGPGGSGACQAGPQ
jgi:hypothetical protein